MTSGNTSVGGGPDSHGAGNDPDAHGTGADPDTPGTGADLPSLLTEQIDFHIQYFMRPRLEGLTDEEYYFDPTGAGTAWTVHPRAAEGEAPRTAIQGGGGQMVIDFEYPEPQPAPLTTIAWRLGHVIVGVLAARSHSHFDGPEADYMSWEYATTAEQALTQFDTEYERWMRGVRSWSADDLTVAVGPLEPGYEEASRATLVAHINRELIHHLAEVALLRDLYAHRG